MSPNLMPDHDTVRTVRSAMIHGIVLCTEVSVDHSFHNQYIQTTHLNITMFGPSSMTSFVALWRYASCSDDTIQYS